MSYLTEFNEEEYKNRLIQEAQDELGSLYKKLKVENRLDEFERCLEDKDLKDKLLAEMTKS